MYPQLASAADKVDMAFLVIFGVSVAILLGITFTGLYFVYRYHHTRHPEPAQIDGNVWAELAWTLIPTALVMVLFYYGWTSYQALRSVPADAMQVKVTSRMWSWIFEYENGKRSDILVVPEGQAVQLRMTSLDVIHSFYVPAFRIKMDTVPGMETYTWFQQDEPGEYDILCAEYCGLKHANMLSVVKVVSREDYETWLQGESAPLPDGPDPVALLEQHGCLGCHSLDGSDNIGPTFSGLYGRETTFEDGTSLVVDENYIRESILDPEARIPQGFHPVMPGYEGMIPDEELDIIVTYLTRGESTPEPPGRTLAEGEGCLSCHSTDGTIIAGPSFKDLYMSQVQDTEGVSHLADDAYLRQAILEPDAVLSAGHDPIMPPYDYLSGQDVTDLIDYIKGLSSLESPAGQEQDSQVPEVPDGQAVAEREGCFSCHSTDGSESMGPTFRNMYMRLVPTMDDGGPDVVADEPFLHTSITNPAYVIHEGFDDMMPPYDYLDEADISALIDYIKTLADPLPETEAQQETEPEADSPPLDGQAVAEREGCFSCHSTDGSESMGPTFRNMYMRLVPTMDDGGPDVVADEPFLHTSITNPAYVIHEGFDDMMPPYDYLDEADISALIDYIKTLADPAAETETGPGEQSQDAPPAAEDLAALGRQTLDDEGCLSCHSLDGRRRAGPTLKDLYMSQVETDQGTTVLADDDYLRASILRPEEIVRKGYGAFMPIYDHLDDRHVEGLIAFIKTLGN